MTALSAILAGLLLAIVLVVVGIALGPAILVLLFIGGIAACVVAAVWIVASAREHHEQHRQSLHT
jgi:hypothetical protein